MLDKFELPTKTINNIYKDSLQPATKEFGKTIALIPRLINVALQPLEKFIYTKEVNFEECKKLILEKSKSKSPDNIVSPEPYVAVPAIQALSYCMDSHELRNAYANLLSASIDVTTKDFVHPSFVESLRQLSPVDVKIFDQILKHKLCAIVDLISSHPDETNFPFAGKLLETNISGLSVSSHLLQSASFNLLSRLGFIEIRQSSITDETYYSRIFHSEEYQNLYKKHSDSGRLKPIKKLFIITDLGSLFAQICFDS